MRIKETPYWKVFGPTDSECQWDYHDPGTFYEFLKHLWVQWLRWRYWQ